MKARHSVFNLYFILIIGELFPMLVVHAVLAEESSNYHHIYQKLQLLQDPEDPKVVILMGLRAAYAHFKHLSSRIFEF